VLHLGGRDWNGVDLHTTTWILTLLLCIFGLTTVVDAGLPDTIEDPPGRGASPDSMNDFTITELFRAETPGELEAAIAGGYPMPWLEEVLADTTIPCEDWEWLDHRMRAAFAQELHLFFDEEGTPVPWDAEWVLPSEDYWRETFFVRATGTEHVTYPIEFGGTFGGTPADIVNAFGEKIGFIAVSGALLNGARDGSLYATALTDGNRLLLFYPDGSYFVSPIEMGYGRCAVSLSGEYVFLAAWSKDDYWGDDDLPPRAILVNREGEIQWQIPLEEEPVGNPGPVISSNDRFCAVASAGMTDRLVHSLVQVYDLAVGQEILRIEQPTGYSVSFSPDGNTFFVPGSARDARAIDLTNARTLWQDTGIDQDILSYSRIQFLAGTNDADLLTAWIRPVDDHDEWPHALINRASEVLIVDPVDGSMGVSPAGYFLITENYQPGTDRTVLPFIVRRLRTGAR